MRNRHLKSVIFWIGLIAVAAINLAQTQLSSNIIVAALSGERQHGASGGHTMPDGTFIAGPMLGQIDCRAPQDESDAGGHTHKGHADCQVCGAVAAMASLSAASAQSLRLPDLFCAPPPLIGRMVFIAAPAATPYAPRAPPHQHA